MITNKLKINDKNMECLILATPNVHAKITCYVQLKVGPSIIEPSSSAKNLGVTFNMHVNMEAQVTNICRSAKFLLRNIGVIRRLLTGSSAKPWSILSQYLGWTIIIPY